MGEREKAKAMLIQIKELLHNHKSSWIWVGSSLKFGGQVKFHTSVKEKNQCPKG